MIVKLIMYDGMIRVNDLPPILEDEYDDCIDAKYGLTYVHNNILRLLNDGVDHVIVTNSYYAWTKLSPFIDSYIYENGEIIPARDILYEDIRYVEDEDTYIKYLGPEG